MTYSRIGKSFAVLSVSLFIASCNSANDSNTKATGGANAAVHSGVNLYLRDGTKKTFDVGSLKFKVTPDGR